MKDERPVLSALGRLGAGYAMSERARTGAAEAILDLVTAVAAAPARDLASPLLEAFGHGASHVWFAGEAASPVAAAFANALRGAALDLDDGHRKARGHPGAAIIPAVFALADRLEATGRTPDDETILRAIAVGFEIGLRVASARGFYARTGFWAGFAAAAGAGAITGLDAERFAHALAIAGETAPHMATTTAPPAWPQPAGSDVKEGIPWGVAAGISAVSLAGAGLTGPLDLVDHAPFFDAAAILAERALPAICETYTKFHAACRHVHAPVEAFLALAEAHRIEATQISRIEVEAYSGALRIPNRPDPRNLVEAQYSIPYCIGLVATRGGNALLPMTAADLHDPAAEALARKITLAVASDCEARFPSETPVRVIVHARGEVFRSPVTVPSGEADARPDWERRIDKFRRATRRTLSPDDRDRLLDTFDALRMGRLTPLRQCLASRLVSASG